MDLIPGCSRFGFQNERLGSRLNALKQGAGIQPERMGDIDQLYRVQPSLPCFVTRHDLLLHPEASRDFLLGQAQLQPSRHQLANEPSVTLVLKALGQCFAPR